jgi:hypothetical protein
MAKIVEFRRKARRRGARRRTVALAAVDTTLCEDIHLRNLIDGWIVPKLVDDWMSQPTDPDSHGNADNGEQS